MAKTTKEKKMNDHKTKSSSFVDHLTELRKRLIKSVIYLFIFFIICYIFSENIYNFLIEPYADMLMYIRYPYIDYVLYHIFPSLINNIYFDFAVSSRLFIAVP